MTIPYHRKLIQILSLDPSTYEIKWLNDMHHHPFQELIFSMATCHPRITVRGWPEIRHSWSVENSGDPGSPLPKLPGIRGGKGLIYGFQGRWSIVNNSKAPELMIAALGDQSNQFIASNGAMFGKNKIRD